MFSVYRLILAVYDNNDFGTGLILHWWWYPPIFTRFLIFVVGLRLYSVVGRSCVSAGCAAALLFST